MAERERHICDSAALAEGGDGIRFAIDDAGGGEKGFAVRFRGRACGYVNRCPHMGTELDWEPGRFFELTGLYLICSTHGAIFEPGSGFCVAGPCRGASLQPLEIRERDGRVFLIDDKPESESARHDGS